MPETLLKLPDGDWLLRMAAGFEIGVQPYALDSGCQRAETATRRARRQRSTAGSACAAPVPNRHPSGLHDWPNANLLCLNAYTSKYQFVAGSIHSVRLYTRDESGHPRLLGTAPVERDGSFFVQVPSEQPLQFELIDAAGKSLQRESGYFWMRRGEQRVCVGCHAGPETAPENAVPQILLKSTTPADLSGSSAQPSAGGH